MYRFVNQNTGVNMKNELQRYKAMELKFRPQPVIQMFKITTI